MPRSSRPRRPAGAVRRELDRIGHRPRKRLGQHFLADLHTAEKIVDLADLQPGEMVIEIGPGLGVLSDLLVPRSSRLLLIEIDAQLAADLCARYRYHPHVQVVRADALEIDFDALVPEGERAVGIGNLPYNVATPIMARVLEQRHVFRRCVFMLQREVARRLAAPPGGREYGVLSVMTQVYADVHMVLRVPPGAFVPVPKVESTVVVLDPLESPRTEIGDPKWFAHVVRSIFQHRRKQLANAARGLCAEPADALRAAGIDPARRPETLSLEELARLARTIS